MCGFSQYNFRVSNVSHLSKINFTIEKKKNTLFTDI